MQDVETTVGVDSALHHAFGVGGFGDVSVFEKGGTTFDVNLRHRFFACRFVDVDDDDLGPFFGKKGGGGTAHARAGTGDQGDLSG